MKLRITATGALALMLGAWAYLDEWSYEQADSLHATLNSTPLVIALFLLTILGGALVGRAWVLLALLGPVASLAYLESTGHRGPDGISPLTSPPGIAHLIWFALLLGLGTVVSVVWRHFRGERSRRNLRST